MPRFKLFVRSVNLASEVDLQQYEDELCAELSDGLELFGSPIIIGSPDQATIVRELVAGDDDEEKVQSDWG